MASLRLWYICDRLQENRTQRGEHHFYFIFTQISSPRPEDELQVLEPLREPFPR